MRRSVRSVLRLVGALGLLLASAACSTDVGDECTSDAECGRGRICDRASRAGYCTVSPCAPNSCPENSVCVRFENDLTYCMALCDTHEDCREGYSCVDRGAPVTYCRQSNRH